MATFYNPYRYATGPWSGFGEASRDFDGINDYISMGDVSELDFNYNDPMSVSFWCKQTAGAAAKFAVGKQSNSGAALPGWGVFTNNPSAARTNFAWQSTNASIYHNVMNDTDISTDDGAWHHFICTKGTGTALTDFVYYIDNLDYKSTNSAGRKIVTHVGAAHTQSTLTPAVFAIGARNAAQLYLDGQMADVRVYNKVLSAAEADDLYNGLHVSDSLVGWWKLNETGANPTFTDYSVNTNDGTNNGTTESTDGPADA